MFFFSMCSVGGTPMFFFFFF